MLNKVSPLRRCLLSNSNAPTLWGKPHCHWLRLCCTGHCSHFCSSGEKQPGAWLCPLPQSSLWPLFKLWFLLPIFSKWLTLPLKPSSENVDFAHCSVPKSAKTVDTRWAQDQYLLNGQMNKLTKVQVCIWSFHCICNMLGETCLTWACWPHDETRKQTR